MIPQSITLCLMIKNEARYITEWLAYHRSVGFHDFLIIDNESDDETGTILEKLQTAGVLKFFTWKTSIEGHNQMLAYMQAKQIVTTEWLCFLDIDEFLVLHGHLNIDDFLSTFDNDISLIALNWRIFGNSYQELFYSDPSFLRFTMAAERDFEVNLHLKYIVRTSKLLVPRVHSAVVSSGRIVNDCCQDIIIIEDTWSQRVSHEIAQVNHYLIRSRQEFVEKAARGRVSQAHTGKRAFTFVEMEDHFNYHNRNDEEDISILKKISDYARERQIIERLLTST